MKFDNLFNQVFLTEQEDISVPETGGVATPDAYDVEPAPVVTTVSGVEDLKNYITKLDEFTNTLNAVEGESLQKLVNDLDRAGSLFQGISRETSKEIIRIAEQVSALSEIIKGFIINSAKRSRDIAASQPQ